ncbi:MAG: hypothetical protein AB9917_08520 [Negativicutes bacterium]
MAISEGKEKVVNQEKAKSEPGLDFSDHVLCEMILDEKKSCLYFLSLGIGIGFLIDFLRNFNLF